MTISVNDGRTEFVNEVQPFAKSFRDGDWVLLDEMNLAEECALKVVMDAMETGQIVLQNQSSALNPTIRIERHKEFRLFATMNPWQAGKRERMSDAFTSQFSVMHFKELPKDEWKHIVEVKLKAKFGESNDRIVNMAKKMTDFHCQIREDLEQCAETGNYAEITNRELLMWATMITGMKDFPKDCDLGRCAWLIYGCRFRADGRHFVRGLLERRGLLVELSSDDGNRIKRIVDAYSVIRKPSDLSEDRLERFWKSHFPDKPMPERSEPNEALRRCISTHDEVMAKVASAEFMHAFGIYTAASEAWLVRWIREALSTGSLNGVSTSLGILGAEQYVASFRSPDAKTQILEIFADAFEINPEDVQTDASIPDMPVALTSGLCDALEDLIEAIDGQHPILIEGRSGSFKTCLAEAVAFLLGSKFERVTLTPESEPSAMLGEQIPTNASEEGSVQWKDGPLTRAFVHGDMCIVDNLGQAEPVVQERINPILESPKFLCLTERGDTEPLKHRSVEGLGIKTIGPAPGFQFIATYTPKGAASRGYDATSKDLTVALFNRFIVVHIDDPCQSTDPEFEASLRSIAKCCFDHRRHEQAVETTIDCAFKIKKSFSSRMNSTCTFRDFVTFLDVVSILVQKRQDLSLPEALNCAVLATFAARIKDQTARGQFLGDLRCPSNALEPLKLLEGFELAPELVLTDSRRTHAQAVLLGALVDKPVLLEGKPAVGKTSLVVGLKKFAEKSTNLANDVRILSNSDTTTVQDYFGSWMPSQSGFAYSKGILIQAIESGDWFVADEFNLAPVSVVSAIMPFLEGARVVEIPGTDIKVDVHPRFRFFATQNPSKGGKDGRNLLPITVRNRFLEVDVEDFPEDEFAEILHERFERQFPDAVSLPVATSLAKLYSELEGQFKLTMRDLIKIVRRFVLLNKEKEGSATWPTVVLSFLGPMVVDPAVHQQLVAALEKAFGEESMLNLKAQMTCYIEQRNQGATFHQGPLQVYFPDFELKRCPLWKADGSSAPTIFQKKMVELAFAIKANEPVLLYGETSFKSELIKAWLQISGKSRSVETVHLTSESETSELVGQIQLTSFTDVLRLLQSTGCFVLETLKNIQNSDTENSLSVLSLSSILSLQNRFDESIRQFIDDLSAIKPESDASEKESIIYDMDGSTPTANEVVVQATDSDSDDSTDVFDCEFADDESKASSEASGEISKANEDETGFSAMLESDCPTKRTQKIEDLTGDILRKAERMVNGKYLVSFHRILHRLRQIKKFLRSSEMENSRPCFMFRDGPFVKAITLKNVFVVEDYDICPQSVTERLNSALETDPSFTIPEDVSYTGDNAERLEIPKEGYAFIATAHMDSSTRRPDLSDATRSRLTQIRIPAYSHEDMMSIVETRLRDGLSTEEQSSVPNLLAKIRQVQSHAIGDVSEISTSDDFRKILRWIDFIVNHPKSMDVEKRCSLGAKFFYLSSLPDEIQNTTLEACFDVQSETFKTEDASLEGPIKMIAGEGGRTMMRLDGIGLTLETMNKPTVSPTETKSKLQITTTVLTNMASIFASICTSAPLLLEGPPGIGKVRNPTTKLKE